MGLPCSAGLRLAGGKTLRGNAGLRGDADLRGSSRAWLAVRPEKLALAQAGPGHGEDNALEAEVVDISYSGQHLSIRLRVAGTDALVLAKVDTGDPAVAGIECGQSVWCCWPPAASRILPRES